MEPQINHLFTHHTYHKQIDYFGRIIGTYRSQHIEHAKSSHLVLKVDVDNKIYEADVNIHSRDGSNVEYAIMDIPINNDLSDLKDGIDRDVHLSYTKLGLKQTDFESVNQNDFYTYLSNLALHADKIIIYGFIYHDPHLNGIHDIHMCSQDMAWSRFPIRNEDGAIGFYFGGKEKHVQWVYIKFATQYLPSE